MPETPADKAFSVAERLRKKIANLPFTLNNENITVTTSIGLTSLNAEKTLLTADEMIKQADELLYVAKNKGRNCTEASEEFLDVRAM